MSLAATQKFRDDSGFGRLVFNAFEKEKALFFPLEIRAFQRNTSNKRGGYPSTVTLAWQGQEIRFQIEIKSRTAPKIVQEAFWKLRNLPDVKRNNFLVVVPYITPTIREMAERETVSCIDLSGNFLIQNPKFIAIRMDQRNRFPESAVIKRIFSGNSSQVGRLFLSEKRSYGSVNEIFEAITNLGGSLSLSAVSKVLSGLQDELIIEKENRRITLLQPKKLLDRLQTEYATPKSLVQLKLKIPGKNEGILKTLASLLAGRAWTVSGECSAEKYTMTTPPSILRVYAAEISGLQKYEDDRFCNVILERAVEPYIYFDRQFSEKDKLYWASRLQTYLELARMDKRERETAELMRADILKKQGAK
jgi:hypothetical protein